LRKICAAAVDRIDHRQTAAPGAGRIVAIHGNAGETVPAAAVPVEIMSDEIAEIEEAV
jgi:hypothetical protein